MPSQPRDLMEELVEEILLRFPPDDPASLVRAAAVCKLWYRLISSTAFRRRFREFHHNATLLLGVISTGNCKVRHGDNAPRDTVRAPDGWIISGARHGRVLLYRAYPTRHTIDYSVWDPVTDEQRNLPELPYTWWHHYSTTVVCAAAAGGNCDHLDCHRGPFLVVVMEIMSCVVHMSVYSSKTGAWSHLPDFWPPFPGRLGSGSYPLAPSVLVGSALYLLIKFNNEILKFDLATQEVSVIRLPSKICHLKRNILLTNDAGGIGFVVDKNVTISVPLLTASASKGNTPGKAAVSTITTEDDAVPAPRPKRLRRPSTRVFGPVWQV